MKSSAWTDDERAEMARQRTRDTAIAYDHSALIARATERNCPDCRCKIDRVSPPDGFDGAPDGKCNAREDQMWPVWRHHTNACPLRVEAERRGLP